jgi:hypothetical protein
MGHVFNQFPLPGEFWGGRIYTQKPSGQSKTIAWLFAIQWNCIGVGMLKDMSATTVTIPSLRQG